jgi:gamma-glutamyltranspeptidase
MKQNSIAQRMLFYDANNSREKRKIIYGSWISGGSTIITSVLQTILISTIFHAQAVSAARFHHQWLPDLVLLSLILLIYLRLILLRRKDI